MTVRFEFLPKKPMLTAEHAIRRETAHRLARRALFGFIVTFVLARIFVFLIMAKEMPNLYFFMRGTHVHHLNYGIFLLAAVCGYSVFRRPTGRKAEITALVYGAAMGLTFDEFGMWLHLGGSYWQRASVDGVIVVAAMFALVAFARSIKRFEKHHHWMCAILLALVVGHPKAATWIAEAVNAESPNAQGDVTASIAPASPPMRKPIESNAWTTEVVARSR